MVYAMFIYIFFTVSELFKEFYSDTEHIVYWEYLLLGVEKNREIAIYGWSSFFMALTAFLLFLIPKTRKNFLTLNIGAVLIYFSVYLEKGITLIVPGFTPDALGQYYFYVPSDVEVRTAVMIFSFGALLFTFFSKIAIAILYEGFSIKSVSKKKKLDVNNKTNT